MKPISEDLYKKIVAISNEVKKTLQRRGIAIPIDNDDGTTSIGNYTIVKNTDGFYAIVDYSGEGIVEKINLPQTAILVANDLALGRFLNNKLIQHDRDYGYALFEETLYQQTLKKNIKLEKFDINLAKCVLSKARKEANKQAIDKSFEKLRKLA